jgi:hypothetical protein
VRNIELNGHVPDLAETQRLATWQYGHFTSMQVRGFAVRGLALHLAGSRTATSSSTTTGWASTTSNGCSA